MHHRIHTNERIVPGTDVSVTGEEFHHAVRAARVREGEAVELFDGSGTAGSGTVETIASDHLIVRLREPLPSRESPLAITLAMAIIHLDAFELVLQKASELGVAAIAPITSDHVDLRPERYRGKRERWERIVFEAVKQSGRSRLPRIEQVQPFAEAVKHDGVKIVFDAGASVESARAAASEALTLFVGPEGGWSEPELRLAHENGCRIERLGPRRLRAETAAIVACTLASARYGDLR